MSEWISIVDRLPEPDSFVQVRKSDGEEVESYFVALVWSNYNLFFCNVGSEAKAAYWKPITA